MNGAKKVLFSIFRMVVGIALVLYLWQSGAINWAAMAGLVTQWEIALAIIVLLLLDAVALGWRLRVLLDPLGFHIPLLSAFRLTMIGVFFNSCLPGATGGDLVKIYYATEGNPGRATEVGTIVLLDRAVGMFALMVLPLLLLPFFPDLSAKSAALRAVLWTVAGIAAAIVTGTLMFFSERLRKSAAVEWAIRRLPLGRYIGIIYDTLHAYRAHPSPLFNAVGISLLAHTLTVSIAMLSALATHPGEFAWKMCVVIPIGFAANALPVTPGGLGVGEAAFSKLFALAGMSSGAEALLGWRVLTLLISPLGLVYYLQGRKRFVHDVEDESAGNDPQHGN